MKVLIVVTHLLGAGHLTRAAALARAFSAAGHDTVLVSGGRPSPMIRLDGVRLVQLPPVRIEGFDFARLIGPGGETAGAALFAARQALLLETLTSFSPDAVLTELFPFGRRSLTAEFMALIEAARSRPQGPLILASVRDILVPPDRSTKVDEAHTRVSAFYDGVLVHGDPSVVPLDASWPVDAGLAAKLHFTGYVDEGGETPRADRRQGILVAAGSSAAGLGLFQAAIGAARARPDLGWRILVGHFVPDAELARLGADLPPETVTRARPDYRSLMAAAAVSVSQCGYNTAVDILATGTPAVLVPFEAGRETEQRLRAERLAALGLARILPEAALTPESLLATVLETAPATQRTVDTLPPAARPDPNLDGGRRTVAIVEEMEGRVRNRSNGPFDHLRHALDRAENAGRRVLIWWRDDDAVAASPALDRLLALAGGRPILIAAIPAGVEPSLGRRVTDAPGVRLAVHGLSHANHAPAGEKSAEFGPHRPLAALCGDARNALRLARERLPATRLLPVFVPPWNRIAPDLAAKLAELGFVGLSAAGGEPLPGIARADSPFDIIDWRGSRSLRDRGDLLTTLIGHVERGGAPLGLLTHHLAHDEAIWDFLAELIATLDHPAVRWHDPRDLFRPVVDVPARAPISLDAECPRAG